MSKKNNKTTLADKIAGILTAVPVSFDPEDDIDVETNAKVIEDTKDIENDNDEEEELLSKFRKQNIDLLEDVDNRYAGKKGSRKKLNESDSESDDDHNDVTSDEDNNINSNDDKNSISKDDSDNEDSSDFNDDSDENETGDSESDTLDKYGVDFDASMLEDDNFKHLKDSDVSVQMKKGICIRNQLNLWESLLEVRIQLQKCLIVSNKLPQYEAYSSFKSSQAEFGKKVNSTKKTILGALDKMLELQNVLIKKYPETKRIFKNSTEKKTLKSDDNDEEIPSDTEEESLESESEHETDTVLKKKRKLEDYENEISDFHKKYKTYRNSVIQKWNEKTRIGVGKSNSATHSVVNQIEHNLADHAKLIKRTQLKRTEYAIIGFKPTEIEETNIENQSSRNPEEYNTEIFDDDDFYHQLLRELIEAKSADLTDPVQLGRQWIQLQNLRSKMKRKIDTKATKGRKIRYAVHSKLVNFMAPNDSSDWTDDAKNELFSSLFGKNNIMHSI